MSGQIVTLLFTDLAGSSALLQRLGDEAGEGMRRRHFSILREAVSGAGGEEVKNLGDGLMVVFDSGVAAARCAIAMQRAIERHNRTGGPQLGVRVGLHVGEPIRDEDDYFGAAVVVAKRLCDAAEAGQILASSLVRGLIAPKSEFAFTPVGDVPLKGMNEPVGAYAVEWREPEPVAADRAARGLSTQDLIGRHDHLARLEGELEGTAGGSLRAVLVLGEAGVGKTRLTSEFLARNRERTVGLSARAYPLGATSSLGLWVEALERRLRTYPEDDVLELCGGHAEDLASLLPSVRAACRSAVVGEPPRIRLLGALASLLDRMAERSEVIVVLDDVHLADGSSWEALNYLSRNLSESRLLILLVARPAELAEHPVASEVVRSLEQEGVLTRLTLTPLSTAEVRQLAAALVGGPVPDALVDWLIERAEGSPLFVTGLVRALLDEGADLEHPSLQSLPEGLADRVEARLRDLDGPARSNLELLAVIGYRAELGDLLRLSGQSLDDLAGILERLQRVRLVTEVEEGRELLYEIAHPLIQEAIYRQIGGARRRALHRHAARVLVEAGRFGAAASHVVQAADPGDDEAIGTLCEALRRAEAGEHHREALALLEALVEMVPAGDRRWLKVLDVMPLTPEWIVDHRADANASVGVRAMRRADQVLEQAGDPAHRAAVKFSLGSLLAWGMCELDSGRDLVTRARELFAEAGDERSVLLTTNELSYHAAHADDGAGHERLALEVLDAAGVSGDPVVQLQALCSLAWAHNLAGRLTEALPVIDRGIEVATMADKAYRRCYLLAMRASVHHLLGRPGAVEEIEAAKEMNAAYRDTLLLDFAAQIAWESGDLQGAVAAALDQMAWDGGISTRRSFGAGMAVMSLAELGRHDEAANLQATMDAAFRGRSFWALSRLAAWSGAVATGLAGDGPRALERLIQVTADSTGKSYWGWGRWMLADLAETAVWQRDQAAAESAARMLSQDPCPAPGPTHDGLRALVTGAARLLPEPADEATQSLEDAASHFRLAGWKMFEGRSLALLAAATARSDRSRAIEVLEQAAALFGTCGARVRRQSVVSTLDALGSRGRRKKTDLVGIGALTSREREVAKLATKGCSARDIAERLFIGERTVESHLANVYAKLGVASKVDLVRRADELGL